MNNSKILFVSHEATRTGAPIVLLTLLRWLKTNTNIEITILLKQSGELHKEFAEIGETFCWSTGVHRSFKHDLLSKAWRRITKPNLFVPFPSELEKKCFDVIYLNTAIGLEFAPLLKEKFRCPVIAHIHENAFLLKSFSQNFLCSLNIQHIERFIAVSESTKESLVNNYQIPTEKIDVIYEFINISDITKTPMDVGKLKMSLKINKDEFVVGGCGTAEWRKGIDLFIYTAAFLKRNFPDERIKFVWVGEVNSFYKQMFAYEIVRFGISDMVIFTGASQNVADYFKCFNVFFLSSREDPFPLVCLEAAALQTPILCFQNAGGMNEFIKAGGGANVEYANIEAVASRVVELKNNKALLKEMAETAQRSALCYDVHIVAPSILKTILGVYEN
ncbi:MAG TPA: glycosyltransferase family 4 protein [Parafilimonas sp.]|nr:glycosyltransferase family 4 protein [Parafilimonas sp.]